MVDRPKFCDQNSLSVATTASTSSPCCVLLSSVFCLLLRGKFSAYILLVLFIDLVNNYLPTCLRLIFIVEFIQFLVFSELSKCGY